MEPLVTEPLERVSHIERLPIFYTAQEVLLPFEQNKKLIFGKPAARELLRDALYSDDKMFGVSFLDEAVKPLLDRPPAGSLGTVAFIHSVGLSKGGGKIAKISGIARYRIEEYVELDKPYPIAEVTFFKDEPEDEKALTAATVAFAQDIQRVMNKIAREVKQPPLREPPFIQPIPMTFIAADLFSYGTDTRQEFLKMRSTGERLAACRERLAEIEAETEKLEARSRFASIYSHIRTDRNTN